MNRIHTRERPLGDQTYTISPLGRSGNYYQHTEGAIERVQVLTNVNAPALQWKGQHRLKFGVDANRIRNRKTVYRRPYVVNRLEGSLARSVSFSGNSEFGMESSEFSSYVQDRWTPHDKLLVETGMRLDWDQVLRDILFSPRLAVTWMPWGATRESKLSAGIGVFYDALNLGMLMQSLDQQRADTFYAEDGIGIMEGPVLSSYVADEQNLKPSVYLNWSVGWEQRLPAALYLKTSYVRKHGRNGWSYQWTVPELERGYSEGVFLLGNERRDSFSSVEFTVSRTFAGKYSWLASYVRSSARSTAVLDYSLENPIFGPQGSGPLDWDTPNRLISWGMLPTPLKKYTVAYFMEWHSGFPFSIVNDVQQLVGLPNEHRFPDYFSLNVHVERRFQFLKHQWALRAGFNNLTGHHNPVVVNNVVGSPEFQQFSGGQGRTFTGRIRFIGRN
jgi:outer membrane receptor for ferrienterochelin and colicin